MIGALRCRPATIPLPPTKFCESSRLSEDASASTNVRRLNVALRRVKFAEADHSDVDGDPHEVRRARLDLLAEELRGVFAEVPGEDDQFIFEVSAGGAQPRLWIDVTAFVVVGGDRRTYRFLKDTRLGRTTILESASIDDLADTITNYIAERIIERERALEGDWLMKRVLHDITGRIVMPAGPAPPVEQGRRRRREMLGWVTVGFLGIVLVGLTVLIAFSWLRT
jgi:hypothetical protein